MPWRQNSWFDREIWKKELQLRKLAEEEAIEFPTDTLISANKHKPGTLFECDNCHRTFLSYPQLLNHRCDQK